MSRVRTSALVLAAAVLPPALPAQSQLEKIILGESAPRSPAPAKPAPARPAPPAPSPIPGPAAAPTAPRTLIYLRRTVEPKETAFTIAVPRGWQFQGGVMRVNPLTTNGALNTVGAKFDFAVKRDDAGTAEIHWLPSFTYKDSRRMAGGGYGFPPGSYYMGALVCPLLSPEAYLLQFVFQRNRPGAQNFQVLDRRPLPGLVKTYQQHSPQVAGMGGFSYGAVALTVAYQQNGVAYKEKLVTVIEDCGELGVGAWANKDTLSARAPAAEFDRLAPLFALIQSSIMLNPVWLDGERRASADRAQRALDTQRYIQKVAAEIVENRRRTNAEIAYSMWLNMTNQEDYVNPYTGQVELGSNQWRNRWQAENGDIIYTDDDSYDPNRDPNMSRSDFRRSRIRPR